MKTYYVDLENVNSKGIEGVGELDQNSKIYIFYSNAANKLDIKTVEELTNSKSKVEYRKLHQPGHNAMDFEIVSLMASMIGEKKEGEYIIISQDKGFEAAIRFLNKEYGECKIKAYQAPSVRASLTNKNITITKDYLNLVHLKKESKENEEGLLAILTPLVGKAKAQRSYEIVKKATGIKEPMSKDALYRFFVHQLGQKQGLELYNNIKSHYSKIVNYI